MNEGPQDFTNAKDSPIYLIGIAWLLFVGGLVAFFSIDHRMRLSTGNIRFGGIPYSIRDGLFVLLFVVFITLTALGSGKTHHPAARALFCILQLIPAFIILWIAVIFYYLGNGIDTL